MVNKFYVSEDNLDEYLEGNVVQVIKLSELNEIFFTKRFTKNLKKEIFDEYSKQEGDEDGSIDMWNVTKLVNISIETVLKKLREELK